MSLGYILFGIMHRPVLAAVGVGFAAAFYPTDSLVIPFAMAAALWVWFRTLAGGEHTHSPCTSGGDRGRSGKRGQQLLDGLGHF